MKPWEETWEAQPERVVDHTEAAVYRKLDDRFSQTVCHVFGDNGEQCDVARFIAAAPDLYRALKAVEWVRDYDNDYGEPGQFECPMCEAVTTADPATRSRDHHEEDCALAAALRKAEGV